MVWPKLKDHAQERDESFYAKIKVSAFVNFTVDCLKKMMKNRWFGNFPCILVAARFTSFESLTVYRNTRRAGCVSEKVGTIEFKSIGLLYLLRLNGRVNTIPTERVY